MPKGISKGRILERYLIGLFLFGFCMTALPSRVEAQVSVAVVELTFLEEFPPGTIEEVKGALSAGLLPIVSRVIYPPEVQEPACEQPECIAEVAQAVGAQTVLRARLSQVGQNYHVETELALARDTSTLGSVSLACEVCSWTEALDTIRRAGEGLRPSLPGLVSVTASPEGAAITLDGTPLETPGQPGCLSPGNHIVEASLEGHIPQSREVNVIAGALSEVNLTLTPERRIHRLPDPNPDPDPDPDPVPTRTRRDKALTIGGIASIGAGALSLGAGIYWLTLEGRCARNTGEIGGICVDVYFTWPQGLAFAVAGAGLVAAGTALLFIRRRERRAASRSRPRFNLGVGQEGVVLEVLGNF